MKTKVKSTSSGNFAKGGSGKMAPKTGVVAQPSGTSSPGKGSLSKGMAKGGSTKMFGKDSVKTQKPGTSSPTR
jgi:hypothetical protein